MKGSIEEANGSNNAATVDKSNCLCLERKVIVCDRRHPQDAADNCCLTFAGAKGLLVQHRSPGEFDWKET